jgi:adenylate kinase
MNIIIFVAPPGAGKGSLSQLCVQGLGWQQFSTGNLCRMHIAQGTEIGKKIDFAIKSGKLVSDDLIVAMVRDWFENLGEAKSWVILDGFPRTISQAQALRNMLQDEYPSAKVTVVRLVVPDQELIKRITSRLTCSNKGCQAVYSLIPESGMAPKNDALCDLCSAHLIRRADDEERAITERLKNYCEHELELLNFYRSALGSVIELNGKRSLEEIFRDLKASVGV